MKPGVGFYGPQVLRRAFLDPSEALSAYLDAMQDVIRSAVRKSLSLFHRYQPNTRDPQVQREYLTALGFDLPADDTERVARFFEGHRDYLRSRGTLEGLKLLAWMAVGEFPNVNADFSPSMPLRLGRTRIGRAVRLHDSAVRYVHLQFDHDLRAGTEPILRRFLERDRPINTKYLVSSTPQEAAHA